jgi:prevent-host-death family protein
MRTTTSSIREVKARLSEILRELDHGEEVIITRRGRPRGRLTAVDDCGADDKSSLATLRGTLSQLPDANYQDFQSIRRMSAGRRGGRND